MASTSRARPLLRASAALALGALITICGLSRASGAGALAGSKPSFVVFFIDDGGLNQLNIPKARELGFYGYTGDNGTISTPNLAKLAEDGLTFQTWYSTFHVCSPSRASMMTGRYSVRSGIGVPNCKFAPNAPGYNGCNEVLTADSVGGLPLNETTTAEALKGAGYATAMVGKWHLGQRDIYMPFSRGFDHYLGLPASQDMGVSLWETDGWSEGGAFQPTPLGLFNGSKVVQQPADLGRLADEYASFASDFVRAHKHEPFYLYVAFNHVHQPNSAGPKFCGVSERGPIGDANEEMDAAVGTIMAAVNEARGDGAEVLVLASSDNGAPQGGDVHGNEPLRGYKTMVWEGGFREIGLANWPGRIRAGTGSQAIVSTVDIHPTLLTLAGVPLPADRIIDGIDLSPILFDEGLPGDAADGAVVSNRRGANGGHECFFFFNWAVASNASDMDALAAVRCGDYKMYTFTDGTEAPDGIKNGIQDPPLLFNLAADPGENSPISNRSALYKNVTDQLWFARGDFVKTITPVPSQNARGASREYAVCADPDSKSKYPRWPNCTLNPETWQPPEICGNPTCVNRFNLAKSCRGP